MVGRREAIEAIQKGKAETLRTLLSEESALATARDDQGVSLLMLTLYYRQEELTAAVLAHRTELDLFEAAALGRVERVRQLLDADPDLISAFSPDGFTALHLAAFFGHEETASSLLDRGAPVNATARNPMRVAPLHSAVAAGASGIVTRLLAAGADVNSVQQAGFTPLMGAASGGRREMVEELLRHGADPAARSDGGKTARDLATEKGHDGVAGLL
ncbi:MAG TPA: ankyrin repeat domain-containing protein [Thermoanaerobaculia bacterium]|nr:ankyrin repeat domain-containing protein [Thermoanaerobaculia bacterium]